MISAGPRVRRSLWGVVLGTMLLAYLLYVVAPPQSRDAAKAECIAEQGMCPPGMAPGGGDPQCCDELTCQDTHNPHTTVWTCQAAVVTKGACVDLSESCNSLIAAAPGSCRGSPQMKQNCKQACGLCDEDETFMKGPSCSTDGWSLWGGWGGLGKMLKSASALFLPEIHTALTRGTWSCTLKSGEEHWCEINSCCSHPTCDDWCGCSPHFCNSEC